MREALLRRRRSWSVRTSEVTQNDGGLLLRSQGRWRAWNAGWSGLGALLGDLNCRSVNVRRNAWYRSVERSVCERQNGILHSSNGASKLSGVAT